jgi:hypothetical protein
MTAALQQRQPDGRNDCADYWIAASLNLLFGAACGATTWRRPRTWCHGCFLTGLRMWENGPTTPAQQANIRTASLGSCRSPQSRRRRRRARPYLGQPIQPIVTIGWDDAHVPQIARTSQDLFRRRRGAPQLAPTRCCSPPTITHLDHAGDPAPWGFVNSWADGGSELYWMPDADLQQAWGHDIPLVGSHNAVVITREPAPAASPQPSGTPTPGTTATATATPTPVPVRTPEPGSRGR